jgi:hypothetical protein
MQSTKTVHLHPLHARPTPIKGDRGGRFQPLRDSEGAESDHEVTPPIPKAVQPPNFAKTKKRSESPSLEKLARTEETAARIQASKHADEAYILLLGDDRRRPLDDKSAEEFMRLAFKRSIKNHPSFWDKKKNALKENKFSLFWSDFRQSEPVAAYFLRILQILYVLHETNINVEKMISSTQKPTREEIKQERDLLDALFRQLNNVKTFAQIHKKYDSRIEDPLRGQL